jgi:hypothetical protein
MTAAMSIPRIDYTLRTLTVPQTRRVPTSYSISEFEDDIKQVFTDVRGSRWGPPSCPIVHEELSVYARDHSSEVQLAEMNNFLEWPNVLQHAKYSTPTEVGTEVPAESNASPSSTESRASMIATAYRIAFGPINKPRKRMTQKPVTDVGIYLQGSFVTRWPGRLHTPMCVFPLKFVFEVDLNTTASTAGRVVEVPLSLDAVNHIRTMAAFRTEENRDQDNNNNACEMIVTCITITNLRVQGLIGDADLTLSSISVQDRSTSIQWVPASTFYASGQKVHFIVRNDARISTPDQETLLYRCPVGMYGPDFNRLIHLDLDRLSALLRDSFCRDSRVYEIVMPPDNVVDDMNMLQFIVVTEWPRMLYLAFLKKKSELDMPSISGTSPRYATIPEWIMNHFVAEYTGMFPVSRNVIDLATMKLGVRNLVPTQYEANPQAAVGRKIVCEIQVTGEPFLGGKTTGEEMRRVFESLV